jgi:cell division protein FtsZ
MQLGEKITRGLGSGGLSELAKNLALADKERIQALLLNTDVVFIVAGMGGGMGSGVAPLIASYAKKAGAIVIGIVTMPFSYEGARRLRNAEAGLHNLKCYADTVVVVDNNDLVKQGGKLSEVLRLKLADYVPEITRVMLDDVWQTYRKLERMIGTYANFQEFINTQREKHYC